MAVDIRVDRTPVWDDLKRIAGGYAGDPRLKLPPKPPQPLPGWPVGLERDLLIRRLPVLHPKPILLRDPVAAAFRYEDCDTSEHLLARPPSELAAWRLWKGLGEGRIGEAELHDLARLLGGEARIGRHSMVTDRSVSGHRFHFTPASEVPARLALLLASLHEAEPALPPMLHAVGVYLETLLVHPLPDANGRLARLLFLGSLHRTIGLEAPLYPLGPAIALNREHVLRAYLAWHLDRDPRVLTDFLLDAVAATREAVADILYRQHKPF
jgi:hypothetical protein